MRIAVDPGITGAIAFLDDSLKCIGLYDMPTMVLGIKHTQVNASELAKMIKGEVFHHFGQIEASTTYPTVYIEQVSAMPGQGVTSMFNFGMSYGVILGICGAFRYPVVLVRPNAWKKLANLIGKPKDAARTLAQQFYPEQELSLKKHVGRADALLIARFSFMV